METATSTVGRSRTTRARCGDLRRAGRRDRTTSTRPAGSPYHAGCARLDRIGNLRRSINHRRQPTRSATSRPRQAPYRARKSLRPRATPRSAAPYVCRQFVEDVTAYLEGALRGDTIAAIEHTSPTAHTAANISTNSGRPSSPPARSANTTSTPCPPRPESASCKHSANKTNNGYRALKSADPSIIRARSAGPKSRRSVRVTVLVVGSRIGQSVCVAGTTASYSLAR